MQDPWRLHRANEVQGGFPPRVPMRMQQPVMMVCADTMDYPPPVVFCLSVYLSPLCVCCCVLLCIAVRTSVLIASRFSCECVHHVCLWASGTICIVVVHESACVCARVRVCM